MKTYKIFVFRGETLVNSFDGSPQTRSFSLSDASNTDCANFFVDWKNGAEVLDADGNPLPYSDEALASFGINHGY